MILFNAAGDQIETESPVLQRKLPDAVPPGGIDLYPKGTKGPSLAVQPRGHGQSNHLPVRAEILLLGFAFFSETR